MPRTFCALTTTSRHEADGLRAGRKGLPARRRSRRVGAASGKAVSDRHVRAARGFGAGPRDRSAAALGAVHPGVGNAGAMVPRRRGAARAAATAGLGLDLLRLLRVAGGRSRAPLDSRQGARLLNSLFVRLGLAGVGVFASAGDFGSSCNGERRPGVTWPASSPFVTAVGGTRLVLNKANQRVREVAWNDLRWLTPDNGGGAGGGGFSSFYARPPYQHGVAFGGHGRTVPDIAVHASMLPGYPVVLGGHWVTDAGTSAAARWPRRRSRSSAALSEQRAARRWGPSTVSSSGSAAMPAGRSMTSSREPPATTRACPLAVPGAATTSLPGGAFLAFSGSQRRCAWPARARDCADERVGAGNPRGVDRRVRSR